MTLKRYTAAVEPVLSLAEAKRHLKIDADITGHDEAVADLVSDATDFIERETSRALVKQQWQKFLDRFPNRGQAIELARPPVMAVDRIDFVDEEGVTQTLSPSCYELDAQSETAWLVPAYDFVWPVSREKINAVTITFTSGYGVAEQVPGVAKRAIKLLIRHWFDNPEAVKVGVSVTEVPLGVQLLVDQLRVVRYA